LGREGRDGFRSRGGKRKNCRDNKEKRALKGVLQDILNSGITSWQGDIGDGGGQCCYETLEGGKRREKLKVKREEGKYDFSEYVIHASIRTTRERSSENEKEKSQEMIKQTWKEIIFTEKVPGGLVVERGKEEI